MVELKTLMFTILAPAALVGRGGDDYCGVTAGLSLEEFERAALSHPLFVFGRERAGASRRVSLRATLCCWDE